ncbi:hypothetical protein BKA80DRAFT_307554 [Phyllosticta citrichinensis]
MSHGLSSPFESRMERELKELENFNTDPFPFANAEDLGVWDPFQGRVVFGRRARRNAPRPPLAPTNAPTAETVDDDESVEAFVKSVYLRCSKRTRRLRDLPEDIGLEKKIQSYFSEKGAIGRLRRYVAKSDNYNTCLYTACVSKKGKKQFDNTAGPRCVQIGQLCMRRRTDGGFYLLPRTQDEDEDFNWKQVGYWTDPAQFEEDEDVE